MTGLLQPCFSLNGNGDSDYYFRVESDRTGKSDIAGMGRRFLAITLDWLMSWGFGSLIFDQADSRSLWIPLVFFVEVVLLTWLTGASAGQRLIGLSVRSYPSGSALNLAQVTLRTLLILLVIPAVVFDSEGRGLHDRIVKSAVYRKRVP